MFKNQFLEGKSSVLLFTSLSAASDLKSGPVFFSQLNVSPAVVEIMQLHLFKNYFHHCNHHLLLCINRPQIFVGKSKPVGVPAPVNFFVRVR